MKRFCTAILFLLLIVPFLPAQEWSEEWTQSSLPEAGLTTDDFPLPPNLEVVPPEEVVVPYLVVTGPVSSTEEFRVESQLLYEAMSQELAWQSSIYDFYTVALSSDPLPDIPSQELLKPEYLPARYVITGTVSRDQYDDGSEDMEWVNYTLTAWIPGNGNATRSVQVSSAFVEPTEILDFIPFLVWQLTSVFPVNTAPLPKFNIPEPYVPPDEDYAWKHKWLYLGVTAGLSSRFFQRSDNGTRNIGIALDPAVRVEAQLVSFHWPQGYLSFSLLSGAALNMDNTVYRDYDFDNDELRVTVIPVTYHSFSLSIPVSLKINFKPKVLSLGLYGGVYYNIGFTENPSYTLPLGYSIGFEAGSPLGPGIIYLDIHWSSDLGDTIFTGNSVDLSYRRSFITLAAGYSFGLLDKRRR
jgi:hypothetical protein